MPRKSEHKPFENAERKTVLEEVWHIKDDLVREAGNDVHRLCENTRQWAAAHPHPGPRLRNTVELRRWLAEMEQKRVQNTSPAATKSP